MRKPQPYYRVDVLKDGTNVCAFPSRRPHKSQGRTMASGDPDGCHSFGVFDTDRDMDGFKDWPEAWWSGRSLTASTSGTRSEAMLSRDWHALNASSTKYSF
jgi:hypothetical protein